MRSLPVLALLVTILAAGPSARAQGQAPPPPGDAPWAGLLVTDPTGVASSAEASDARSLERLRGVLLWSGETARARRRTVTWAGLGAGAVLTATGVVALTQEGSGRDTLSSVLLGSVTLGGGLGMLLGVGLGLLIPDPWMRLEERARALPRAGNPPSEDLVTLENEWRSYATRSHNGRVVASWMAIIVGGASGLLGLGALVALPTDDGRSVTSQVLIPVLLPVLGGLLTVAGAALLHSPDEIERSWEVYQRTRPRPPGRTPHPAP
ncbi:MAG: hypothetical protein HY909_06400 [Deltaproteobacteria bacterium]|nr:hypothetical protein [Deltaproteobacteria bacterium]